MEDAQGFAPRLEEKLEAKRNRLDRVELERLKENFKLFQSSFKVIRSILDKKGILHEDPYRYDLKISEVTTPPEGPFSESEKADQMSIRASQFEDYLDFLNNYYQFSTEFLTMGRIKRLLALVKYFNFAQFSETSTSINTKTLAEYLGAIRKGTDQLSSGLVAENLGQLDKATRDILAILKELAAYHKERYKLEVRQLVMPGLQMDANLAIGRREEALKLVKRKFAEVSGESPFYPELVDEILQEDYSSEGLALREDLLRRLDVKEEKKAAGGAEKSFRPLLMEAARALSGAAFPLEDALAKVGEDSTILESRDQGLMSKLKRMVKKMFKPGDSGIHYDIEYLDPVTNLRSQEDLDFAGFVQETAKKARLLASLAQKGSPGLERLKGMPEDQVYKFVQRNIEELQRTLRTLAALDEFFKFSLTSEKARFKSVKIEITTIKGAIIKANQKKHEYVAQQEELEQMKRLGIRDQAP